MPKLLKNNDTKLVFGEKDWRRMMLACKGHGNCARNGKFEPDSHERHLKWCKNENKCPHDCVECERLRISKENRTGTYLNDNPRKSE